MNNYNNYDTQIDIDTQTDIDTPIIIHYLNINGLNAGKLQKLYNLLKTNQVNILMISETWFTCEDNYILSPFFVASSIREDKRKTGHENGGIIILANRQWRKRISITQANSFAIEFTIDSTRIGCVYLPPRLHTNQIEQTLKQLWNSDIIIGDMNFRIGKLNNDSQHSGRDRFELISKSLSPLNMRRIINSGSECSRNDHIFSKLPLSWKYLPISQWNILSDHGIMQVELPYRGPKPKASRPTLRYSLRPLNNDVFCEYFTTTWDQQSGNTLTRMVQGTHRHILSKPTWERKNIQHMIDFCYDNIVLAVKTLQSEMLISYEPGKVRNEPYKYLGNSQIDAIRLFKMANRAQSALNPIRSESNNSLEKETQEHFQKIFAPERSTLQPNQLIEISSDHGISLSKGRLDESINSYSNTKAGGPDGIHIRILKVLTKSQTFLDIISEMFSLIAITAVTPKSWRESNLHPLIKDKDKPFIRYTRPINLTQILRRIFERQCLQAWRNDQWLQVHPMQAGFRNGYSTMTHLLTSDELSRNGNPISVFLDIKAAYDSVDWKILHTKLTQVGCPPQKLNLVTSLMLQSAQINTIVNQNHMGVIYSQRGLFQGSILSPCLFNVFINDLAIKCNTITPSLYFADDILIKSKDHAKAQDTLDECYRWSIANKLEFGIHKCATVSKEPLALKLGNDILPSTKVYKYLGAPHIWNRVCWEQLIESNCSKHDKSLTAISDHQSSWTNIARLAIWRTFIRPKLDYCLAVVACWWEHHSKNPNGFLHSCRAAVDQSYRYGLCFITASRRYSEIMTIVTGIGPLELRLRTLSAGLLQHLSSMSPSNPLRILRANFNNSKYFMMSCLSLHPTYSAYLQFRRQEITRRESLPGRSVAVDYFRLFKENTKLSTLCSFQSKLRSYMTLPILGLKYQYDPSMTSNEYDAVRWRCGSFMTRSKCPICLQLFNRAHIGRCKLLDSCPTYQAVLNSYAFQSSEIASSSSFRSAHNTQEPFYFTVLDYLLNQSNMDQFQECIKSLRETLSQP